MDDKSYISRTNSNNRNNVFISILFVICILLGGNAQTQQNDASLIQNKSENVVLMNSTARSFVTQEWIRERDQSHQRLLHSSPPLAMMIPAPSRPSPPNNSQSQQEMKEMLTASNVFRNLLRASYAKMNTSNVAANHSPNYQEITFHEGHTIATIYNNLSTNSVHCDLIEVITPQEQERALKKFSAANRPVQKTNFRTILAIITACQALEPPPYEQVEQQKQQKAYPFLPFGNLGTVGRNNGNNNNNALESVESASSNNVTTTTTLQFPTPPLAGPGPPPSDMWTVISGILPGTKWCGLGDIARNYNDLGTEKELDKCCRAHDHCPTKLKALRSGYGLVNWSFYTKSHCDCDSLLFDCLKKATNPTAELLGNFYFNILKVQCIEEEEPMKCTVFDDHTNMCRLWQRDLDATATAYPKRMLFRNVRRAF